MNNRTEQVALVIGAVVGMVMAAGGWLGYYLSEAEALLLDGNFSFIGVLAALLAIVISLVKTRTSRTYPFGQFVYEPTYSLFIGLLTVGVIVVAVAGNATKIVDYLQGERFPAIDTSVILVYTVIMAVLCFGLAVLFRYANHRLRGVSTILGAYTVQSTIDGILSAAAGGALSDRAVAGEIRSLVYTHIDEMEISDMFITKTGNSYLVVAFMRPGFFVARTAGELVCLKREVKRELEARLGYVAFELALAEDADPPEASPPA